MGGGAGSIEDLLGRRVVSSKAPPLVPDEQPPPVVLDDLLVTPVWGDFTRVVADLHIVGHYQGVLPVSAELALDTAISTNGKLLITEHTRRGWLAGALGEVAHFPGPDPDAATPGAGGAVAVRRAAVVGLGRPGTFTPARAEQLYASLAREIVVLGHIRTVAAVLVGSGAGTLSIDQAVRALVAGCTAALQDTSSGRRRSLRLELVERDWLRARTLAEALRSATEGGGPVRVGPLRSEVGGAISRESAAVLVVQSAAEMAAADGAAAGADGTVAGGTVPDDKGAGNGSDMLWNRLLTRVPEDVRAAAVGQLAALQPFTQALSVAVRASADDATSVPTRISVVQGDGKQGLRWAALTDKATIPERDIALNRPLVEQLVSRLTCPDESDAAELPTMLTRFIVPTDFHEHLASGAALVLEVDSWTARVPWEFLTDAEPLDAERDRGARAEAPLSCRVPLCRQLRTTYARTALEDRPSGVIRALVIGDPVSDDERSLKNARDEAVHVAELLQKRGATVDLFVGAPGRTVDGAMPATRLDVLTRLLLGSYHVVHFAGHGTFDPDGTKAAGWVFADGLLGARELRQLTSAPRLIVANACWSAARPGGGDERESAADLTPVLADEFLRAGTAHYVGTSWKIPDNLGRTFADAFYSALLDPVGGSGRTVAESVRLARARLWRDRGDPPHAGGIREHWTAWAAYQHYGDPQDVLDVGGSGARRRTATSTDTEGDGRER